MIRSRSRALVIIGGVAAAALAAGVVAGARVTSPADAAARTAPPEASVVTVPVELRELESTVTTRGDASYTGAVDVDPELSTLETRPVVTGHVPEVGDEIEAGGVVIEIVGRPVLALPGDVPMYRSLRPGMSGPDVAQLEEALEKLGFDPGTVDDTYTNATGRVVRELFEQAGYEPPPVEPEVQADLDAAEEAVRMAEDEVRSAESLLATVAQGPTEAEKISAQNAVDQAKRTLATAAAEGDKNLIADAKAELALAEVTQRDLLKGPDTSTEQAGLKAAKDRLAAAQADRDAAAALAGTPVPAAELVFVPSLPRRVDEVNVRRGEVVDGVVMSISGADLVVTANVDAAARDLLDEDMEALLDLPTGDVVSATVTGITEADETGFDLTLDPQDLTPEQVESLRSANVRVTIAVANSGGEVLAVPLAALTAGPSGEARVEVMRGDDDDGRPVSELVIVEVGLTADGYAEVAPVDGELAEGDLVVVGGG